MFRTPSHLCLRPLVYFALLIVGLATISCAQAAEEFYFAQLSDTHWGTPESLERTAKVVEKLRTVPRTLDFIVVTGDVMQEGATAELLDKGKALLESLKVPVYYVPGNHDLSSKEQRQLYTARISPINYVIKHRELALVFVGSRPWGQRNSDTPEQQKDWLETTLGRLGAQPVLLFHHSPPLKELDGESVRAGWEKLLNSHPVKAVFSGHIHKDAMLWFGAVPEYVASCVRKNGKEPLSLRVYGYNTEGRVSFVTFYAD